MAGVGERGAPGVWGSEGSPHILEGQLPYWSAPSENNCEIRNVLNDFLIFCPVTGFSHLRNQTRSQQQNQLNSDVHCSLLTSDLLSLPF